MALVVATGGTASPVAVSPASGRIAFGSFGGVIITNPDGTGQWPMTRLDGFAPGDWSPDGTALAVARYGDIYLVDPSGSIRTRLTYSRGQSHDPAFSPDGRTIAYERFDAGPSAQIWVIKADGSSPRFLPAGFPSVDPAWSPDGSQIAWTSYATDGPEIWVMDFDGTEGSNRRRLTSSPGIDQNPSWSPDGSRIAFDSDRSGNLDVYTMAVDGSDVRQLTASQALDALPEWSPDGSQIAFMSERNGSRAVFVMGASGLGEQRISGVADQTSGPAWQPLLREYLERSRWRTACTIWGTPGDDLLVGGPGRDVICGLDGDDRLIGGGGNDLIAAEYGADSIVGGPGRDIVVPGIGVDLVDVRDGEFDSVGGIDDDTVLVDRGLDDATDADRAFDPDPKNLTRGHPVRASATIPPHPVEYAVDGHTRAFWSSEATAPQWIEVDMGRYATVGRIQLVVAQPVDPGVTKHVVLVMGRSGRWRQLAEFRGRTRNGQVLRYTARRPWHGVRWIRVVTRQSPSWVAWKEIQAYVP